MLGLFRRRADAHGFVTTALQIGFTSIVVKSTPTVNPKRSKCAIVAKSSLAGLDGFLHSKKSREARNMPISWAQRERIGGAIGRAALPWQISARSRVDALAPAGVHCSATLEQSAKRR
jgi:hypothetical protein